MFIYNEVLSWVIDGINREFTTLNEIDRIEEVYLGWAAYRDVGFAWTVVTFAIAPPVWASQPTIDYFSTEPDVPSIESVVTLWDVIADTYDIIWVEETSNVHLERMVKRYIDKGIQKIKNLKYYKDRILTYSFNKAEDSEAGEYSATGVNITEKDYVPANGVYLLRDSVIVEYSTYTDGILNGSPWVVYKKWDDVVLWYKIPSTIKKISEVIIDGVAIEPKDIRDYKINQEYFCIYHHSDGERYLFLPYTTEDKVVTVKYIPVYTSLDLDSDLVDIEYEYSELLSLYAAYKLLLYREDDRWQAIKKEYLEFLRDYKSYKSRATANINNRLKSNILSNL